MASNGFDRKKIGIQRQTSVNYNAIQLAKVKKTDDVTHSGKLWVWLMHSNTNENLETNWIPVTYAPMFGGTTDPETVNRQSYQSFDGTQKSYGFCGVPPHKNNLVLVGFSNGDETLGYWFACVYKDGVNHMVPGIGSGRSFDGNSSNPVAEKNIYSNQSGATQSRASYTPLTQGLSAQGLTHDSLRGAGSSSMWRSNTPDCVGLLSPGGNHIVLDDVSGNEFIRIRTKSGAQILISENAGIYAITKTGDAWVELTNSGKILFWSNNDIDFRSEGNINFSAKGSINFQSTNTINLKSTNAINFSGSKIDMNNPSGITDLNNMPSHEPYSR